MHASLRSKCAKPEAYALPWTEPYSEQVEVLSRLRTEGEMTEMAVNPWVRKSLAFQRHEPSHATICIQDFNQSAESYDVCIALD